MKQKNCSFVQDFSTLERTQKNRSNTHTPRPRKVMGHNSERTRLSPIIVSISLLLLAVSPLTLFFYGDEMALVAEGSPVATVTGIDDDDYFGWNVSGAGDVNGDGYDDVIVGAPGCNGNTGMAYLFFGGPWFSGDLLAQNSNVTLSGDASGDLFGWDVSGAGDVNNDGFDDVLVGAPGADRAYIYYGKSTWMEESYYEAIVEIRDDTLDTTSEVNVDDLKFDDAQFYTVDQNETMFLDGFNITQTAGSVKNVTMYAKYSVEDGYCGISFLQWSLEEQPFSSTNILPQNGETNAVHSYDILGQGVEMLDDIMGLNVSFTNNDNHAKNASNDGNGDPLDDIYDEIRFSDDIYAITSDNVFNDDYIDVYIPDLHVPATATINGVWVTVEYYATNWESEPGDGTDQRDDFEVWNGTDYQHWEDWGGNIDPPDEYWTSSDISPIINTPAEANSLSVRFRWEPSSLFGTLYIDTVNVTIDYTDAGGNDDVDAVDFDYVWINLTLCQPRTILEGTPGDGFGSSVSGVGDVNNDGCDDVIIGAPKSSCDTGAVFIFFGDTGYNESIVRINVGDADITQHGENLGDGFGSSVSCAGDVDNDGFDDIIVGAPGANKAFVFLNYIQNNPVEMMLWDDFEDGILADWYEEEGANGAALVGNASGAINGSYHLTSTDDTDVVSPIIDARGYNNIILTYKRRMRDGDWSGNEDMLVMIRVDGGSWVGIPYEEAHGDTQTPDLIEYRQVDLSSYGANNSIIEIKFDLNDGGFLDTPQEWDFDDVLITGTPYFTNVTLEGDNPGNQFGFSVSNAGDVDDNGYDDIIIGAPSGKHWWDDSWSYRQKLTFNNSGQSDTLVDFPILVNLSALNFNYSRARSDGWDMRFVDSDDVTELKYHIEDWNTSGSSYVWVNVTSIDANSDTDYVWMYYGNLAATDVQDVQGTYDGNFVGVWHLNETAKGAFGEIIDSTVNGNDGTTYGNMDSSDSVSAKIGRGLEFDEIDDLIRVNNSVSLDSANFSATMELWIWWDNAVDGDHQIVMTSSNRFAGGVNDGFEWSSQGDGDHFFYPWGGDNENYNLGPNQFNNQNWHYLTVTLDYSTKNVSIYIDNQAMSFSIENVPINWTQLASADDWLWGGNPDRASRYFDGIMDEIRVSNIVRSADWVSAQYLTMNNSFLTYGISEEEIIISGPGRAYIFDGAFLVAEDKGDRYIDLNGGDVANVTLTGETDNDLFGYSVSSAGNLTANGFSDVIVGAPGANGIGAVYVFYGGSSMGLSIPAASADYTEFGESGMDCFGWSVSGAGDVTQADGYDEIIAGAPFHDPSIKTDAGKAYLLRTVSRPLIRYVTALPGLQISGGNVNISCDVTALDGVGSAWVNISLPGGGYINDTMIQGSGDQWFYNNTYLAIGTYQYTIWANDTNGNWTQSSILQYEVFNTPPVLSLDMVNPLTGFIDTWFNFTVTYTDIDDHPPGAITVNITNYGIIDLIEVDPSDTDYTDGKGYCLNISGFANGTTYSFHFAAHDAIGDWEETADMPGPQVLNSPAFLVSPDINPLSGNSTTDFNFTVTYLDLDNNPPGSITLNLTGPSGGTFTLMETDPLDLDYTDGKQYYYNIAGLSIGSYSFHFAASETGSDWIESIVQVFNVLNLAPTLSQGQVTPIIGFDDTLFNFTVTYTDLDDQAPDTITVNITGLGIYQLNEVDTLDMDYTDGKQYFIEITAIPLGTSYSFHFAANDTLGYWAVETPEIDAPDILQRSATLTALDEAVEYSDIVYLNATLMESGTPIAGEDIEFYIDLNDNGFYEPGEFVGSGTTLGDGSVSMVYSSYLLPGTYNFTTVYIGSGGFDVDDSYAQITIILKPASLTAVSRIAEENEVITLSATLTDINGNPITGEGVEIYLDKNRNAIYEASEMMGYQITSVGGVASITYTVTIPPGDYDIWARYRGSGNYSVTEIEGILVVQNTSNTPPTILGIVPDQIRPEDSLPWTLDLTTYEADIEDTGSDLKWFLTGVDTSLYSVTGYNSSDDVFTFILKENAFGNDEVTLWLVDGSGDWDSQVMWVNITPVNDVPYFDPKPPDIFVHYNDPGTADDDPSPWDYTFYVHDIETPIEDLAILTSEPTEDSGDGYAEINDLNVTFHYPQSRVGDSILVTLTLYDGSDSTQTVITVNVTSDWVPELVLNLPDITIEENTTNYNVFDLDDYFTDRDHDSLFFSSGYQHLTVVINSDNTVDITSAEHWTGSEFITFRAMDPSGAIVEDTITVTVIPVNDGPMISGAPDLDVHYDYSYGFDFTPYIKDPDNPHSELSIWTSELTDNIWVQEYNNLGIVVNYPESMDGMIFPVTIFVSDGVSTASQEIQITISDNFPPELMYSLPDVSFNEDTVFEDGILLSYYFLDIDGDALFFSNGSTFINVVINNALTVDFSAPENWHGFETVTFRATDPTGSIAEDTILIVVVPVNDAPIIDSIPGQEKNEGDQWVLDLSQYIDDVDNDASELIITVESEVGQGYVTLTGDILVFQYPEGINTDIVTITVNDGELETQRSFTVTLHSHTPVAPSILDIIPWLWVFIISFAAMSGAFAFYAKKRKYNVYEAFLIHEKGLPIAHASREEISELEDVVVSGMFTAVQDFISDAFSGKTPDDEWKLDEMKFGENKILIERSDNLYLATIFEGNGERLGSRMRKLLKDIDEKYSDVLTDWDGDMTELTGISAVIAALVSKKTHKNTGSEGSQTEITSELDSEEPGDAHVEGEDIWGLDNEVQETIEKGDRETYSEEGVAYECPECYSEIRPTDIRCPICGVEFSEVNDIDSTLSGDEEGSQKDEFMNKGEENGNDIQNGGDDL